MKEKALKIADALDKFDKNSVSSLFDIGRGASIIRELVNELEIKQQVIDRLVDSQDNARACLSADVEDIERLFR